MGFWSAMFYAVKIVGIISGAIIIAAKIISILLTWADGKDKGYVCMKFRQWRKLYDLNPEEWHADSNNPYRCIYTDRCHKDIYVRFSFFGTACYTIWQSRAEKRKKQARSNAKLQLLLRAAQTDIEKLRAQSEQELAEAKARTEQVRSQLEKER